MVVIEKKRMHCQCLCKMGVGKNTDIFMGKEKKKHAGEVDLVPAADSKEKKKSNCNKTVTILVSREYFVVDKQAVPF